MFQHRSVGIAALVLMLTPIAARADWLFTPILGSTFGADTLGQEHLTYGGALAWRDEEALGLELEMSLSPDFFEDASDGALLFGGSGHVITAMANAIVGLNGDARARVQPYVTAGVGLLQMHIVSEGDLFTTTTYEPGFNAGAGAMAFATNALGVRGDIRYIRSFQNQVPSWTRGTELDVAPGNFDFWRATVGVTFRFSE